jgi:copper oxidase (laccase) domain-containing protein
MTDQSVEYFPALTALKACRHAFIKRIPGIDVSHYKAEVLRRLDTVHREARNSLGMGDWPFVTAQQVHSNKIEVVDPANCSGSRAGDENRHFTDCDGFITDQLGIALGVYVADCCAIYMVDPKTPAVGLVHSGKKGTELNIAGIAIERMRENFGSNPADLIVQLSPCIRPPHYEVDFAAQIREQVGAAGVKQIHDTGQCTACDLDAYYSYRAEKGKTGRMLALLGIAQSD